MRITFDYQIFAGQEYGGISRYFIEMASEFAKNPQLDFQLVAPLYRNQYLRAAADTLPVKGRYLPYIPYLGRATRHMNAALFRAQALLNGKGILHQTYFWEGSARSYWKGPVVLTVYDMIHERYPQYFKADDPTVAQKKKAILTADHIICVAAHVKQDLLDMVNIPKEKVSVIYLAHSPNSLRNTNAALSASITGPYLLYVGPRVGYKNFETLLRAYQMDKELQKDFQLVCCGGGAFSEEEKETISKGCESGRVVQVNGNDDVLATLYSRAAAFVYPSLAEGFGIPPIEAMALSCPVVAGNDGAFAETVGAAGVLCDQRSAESLRAGIRSVVYSEEKRKQLLKAGLIRAADFSWANTAKNTLSLYKGLA